MLNVVAKPKSADLHPGPGFRIRKSLDRPDPRLVAAFADFDTPDISDRMNRLYTMSPVIRCLTDPEIKLVGPVCTVRVFPGDNLMVHKALDVAEPGDVVVVDAGGSSMNAVLGDLITAKSRHRGIAGWIVDGYVRDLPGIRELGIPVFARGVTPIGPLHRGPGEINFPIQCGGIVIQPGDMVVGDANGVVVIPKEIIRSLLDRLCSQKQAERSYVACVLRGEFSNAWVDGLLDQSGCEVSENGDPPHVVELERSEDDREAARG
jgi:RraA family protein